VVAFQTVWKCVTGRDPKEGIRDHDVVSSTAATCTRRRAGLRRPIDQVINDTGDPVTPTHAGPSTVLSYP
jgi:hypothetical protein